MKNTNLFTEQNDRVFTVRLAWNIGQPFVCGTLEEVVKYAIKPNNGIEYFAELTNASFRKVTKKELKAWLSHEPLTELGAQLFKKY